MTPPHLSPLPIGERKHRRFLFYQQHPLPLAGEGRGEGGYDLKWFPPHLFPLPIGERRVVRRFT